MTTIPVDPRRIPSTSSTQPPRATSNRTSALSSHKHGQSHRSKSSTTVKSSENSADVDIAKKRSQFMYQPRYFNPLPLPLAEPKLYSLPSNDQSFISSYICSSIDALSEWEIYTDGMCNVPFQCMDLSLYTRPSNMSNSIDPAEASLLQTNSSKPAITRVLPSQRQLFEQGSVNWLKKPEYTANNLYQSTNKEVALADERKNQLERIDQMRSERDSTVIAQVKRIEQTFADATSLPKHASKPDVHAVSIFPIFPDDAIDVPYVWVEFDDNLMADATEIIKSEQKTVPAENTILVDNDSTQSLYIRVPNPSEDANGTDSESKQEVYEWVREYNRLPVPPISADNNLFAIFYSDRLCYARYTVRHKLAKRARANSVDIAAQMKKRPKQVNIKWNYDQDSLTEETIGIVSDPDLDLPRADVIESNGESTMIESDPINNEA